ncbi:MAG: hypothetical protein AAGF66_18605 [Cyanobacteria bacterium P01_H01_bin.119]
MFTWLLGAASPFQTWEEFEGAIDGPTGGAIYTFADRPALIGIMVAVAALLFLYFIYASFHISSGESTAKSPKMLGLLLVAGMASAMASLYEGVSEQNKVRQASRSGEVTQVAQTNRQLPAALFGMVGLFGISKSKSSKRRRRLNR